MKHKKITYFWIGFVLSAAATAWLYWLWRRSRVIAPAPLVVSRGESYQPIATEVKTGVELASATDVVPDVAGDQPDDLLAISGIGPATARRLNDAGIVTYKQIADLSPERLQEISGNSRWDPIDWINQANELGD